MLLMSSEELSYKDILANVVQKKGQLEPHLQDVQIMRNLKENCLQRNDLNMGKAFHM